MASYLQIENISKSYGQKILFENIGFNVNEGDKIALVAPNGSGKTSLKRILAGKDKSDSGGRIMFLKDIRIAFLEQEYSYSPCATVLEQAGGSQKAKELLTNLKLGDFSRKMSELSGGEIKRVAIAQLLSSESDFLIMDEPTNHLDIEAVEFLENYLSRSKCTLLMVTHDRYFLDRVCNTVMELDHGSIYIYRGDYRNYLEKRQERIAVYNAETDKVRNLLRRELEWIHATPCARSGKAKYRIDAFHSLEERASQTYTTSQLSMQGIGTASRLGTKIIDCRNVSFNRGGRCFLKDFTYNFQRYDKIGVVGGNGIGKTTFLNLLTGEIQADTGTIERGESLRIGYYRQDGLSFEPGATVLDTVPNTHLLERFLFPHEMFATRVDKLSGGEKRRLYLLTILAQEPNLLILDEPTNDLDIMALNALEEYLKDFKGSVIAVSHDRHFLDRIAGHLLVFCGDGTVKDFLGGLSEYRAYVKDFQVNIKSSGKSRKESDVEKGTGYAGTQKTERPKKLSWKQQRELEAIESELASLEQERHSLEQALSLGEMTYGQIEESSRRIQEILTITDEKEMRWLELQQITE